MGYSIKLPTIDLEYTVNISKIKSDKSKIEAAAEEAGEIYNDKFNETVSENTAPPVPTVLTGKFDTKEELADRLSFYGGMRKIFKEAEDAYISLQKAILGGDNKGINTFSERYYAKRDAYDRRRDFFMTDVRGLDDAAFEWVTRDFEGQLEASGKYDKVMSRLRSQYIKKGQTAAEKYAFRKGVDEETSYNMRQGLRELRTAENADAIVKAYRKITNAVSDATKGIKKYTEAQASAAKAQKEAEKEAAAQAKAEAAAKAKAEKAADAQASSGSGGGGKKGGRKKSGGGSGSGGGGDDGGNFTGGGSSDDSNWSHVNEQRKVFNAMKRVYNTAERSYISMQRAILGDDKKGQDFFADLQRSNVASYSNYYRHFQNDDTGLTEDQKEWASRTYKEQRAISERVNKAMSGMRASAIKKGTSLIDDVTKKNAESGGDVVSVKTIEQLKKALDGIKGADKVEEIVASFKKLKTVADSAKEAVAKYNDEAKEQERLAASVEKDTPKADTTVNKINEAIGNNERAGKENSQELLDAKAAADAYGAAKETGDTRQQREAINALTDAYTKYKVALQAANEQERLAASVKKDVLKADTTVNKINEAIGNNERAGKENSQELLDAKAAADAYGAAKETGDTRQQREAINALTDAYTKYKVALQAANEEEKKKTHTEAMTKGLEETQKSLEQIKNMGGGEKNWSNNLRSQYDEATKAAEQLQAALDAGDAAAATNAYDTLSNSLASLSQNFSTVDTAATHMGFSLVESAKQLLGIATPMALFQGAKNIIRNMANEVTTVNTAMAELRKVTDETEVAYSRFLSSATSTAKEIGSTISDLINTSSEFARMGYSMSESAALGKTATIFTNVGDFSNVNDASDTLISTMKGFQLSTNMADDIGDKLNAVANRYAVTAADIGEGLQNAASSLNISGNSLDQSIAMLTTITEITQDASAAGNALKILSLRLRGASAELENMGESTDGMADSTSKLREQIKALTGFDIMKDDNTFKSTYEQMLGISEVWDEMSDVSQSALLELIAGKTRSNQVAALLTNMSQASDILEVSLNSEGSMLEEHERWLDSIEAKQQQVTASFQELAQTVLGSDLVAGTYDAGSGLLGLLNQILGATGTFAPLAGILGTMGFSGLTGGNPLAMFFTKGLGSTDKHYIEEFNKIVESSGTANALNEIKKMANDAGDSISDLANAMMVSSNNMKVMTAGVEGLKTRLKGIGSVVGGFAKTLGANLATMLAITGAMELIKLVYNAIDRSVNNAKYAQEDWDTRKAELDELLAEKDSVTSELEDVNKQITELQSKTSLTFVEQDELSKLKQTSAELELQNKILTEQVKLKEQAVSDAAGKTYNAKYGTDSGNVYQDELRYTARTLALTPEKGYNDPYKAAQNYFYRVKDYEQIFGGNIEGFFQAKKSLFNNKPSDDASLADWEKFYEYMGYYETAAITMFDTLEGLWDAYEFYNEKGLTDNATYGNILEKLKLFRGDDYFGAYYNEMASNYVAQQYAGEFSELTKGIQNGAITEANIQTSIPADMAALITELFGDIGVWAKNVIATYTPEVTTNAKTTSGFATTSLASRITEAGTHAALRDNIIAGEPVTTDDYKKLIEYGDEYAACVENINGTLQVNRQRLDEVVSSEYAQLNEDIATGLQEEKEALAANIASLADYTAQLGTAGEGQDEIIRNINTLTDEIDKNKEAIKTYDVLAAQIEYATSAYKKWVDAHDGKESGAQYDESFNALKDLEEGYESGRVGTNEYKAAQEYLLGAGGTYNEQTAKTLNRYITEDRTGLDNFMNDLLSKGIINAQGTMTKDWDAGSIAEQMNISEELVKAMFMKANEYIADEEQKYKIGNTGYGASEYLKQYTAAEQNYNTAYEAWRADKSDENYQALITAAQAYNNISKQLGFGDIDVKEQENAATISSAADTVAASADSVAQSNNAVTQSNDALAASVDNLASKMGEDNNGSTEENSDNSDGNIFSNGNKPYDNGEKLTLWGKTDAKGVSAAEHGDLWNADQGGTTVDGEVSTTSLTRMSLGDKIADFVSGIFSGGNKTPATEGADISDNGSVINVDSIAADNVTINTQSDSGIDISNKPEGKTNTAGLGSNNNGEAIDGINAASTVATREESLRQNTIAAFSGDYFDDPAVAAKIADNEARLSENGVNVLSTQQNILTDKDAVSTPVVVPEGKTDAKPIGESLDPRLQYFVEDTARVMSGQDITDPDQARAIWEREAAAAAGKAVTDTASDISTIAGDIATKQLEGVGVQKDENFTVADAISIASKNAGENILELGEIAAQAAALKESADRVLTDYNENGIVPEFAKSAWDKIPDSVKTYDGKMDWSTFGQNFVNYIDSEMLNIPVNADTTAAEQKISNITKPETKTVTVVVEGGEVNAYASGTNNALSGISLVDEEGAELIQRANGTYEVGTNSGPRLTELDKGDVVYTADETRGIFRRQAAHNGRRFALGTAVSKIINTAKNVISDGVWNFELPKRKSGKSNKIDFDKLIDWIPTLLDNLKRKTNEYIRMASKAIGYMLKNANIDSAIKSVKDELDYTEQAYNRYLQQADTVAKQTGLTQDIVDLIQQGAIDITQYSDKVKESIEEYQKWWDKAVDLTDALDDLNDQLEELALQKLDNITTYFTDIDDLIDANITAMQDAISVKKAYGEELKDSDYKPMLEYANQAVANLTKYQDTLQKEFDTLVNAGDIQVGSDAWYEYSTNIRKVSSEIANAKVQVSDLNDELDNLVMTNLKTAYEYLQRVQSGIEGVGALNDAQNVARSVKQYRTLISNGMEQIANLEMQNKELEKQMEGLDTLSEKYIELNAQLNDNKESIMGIKQSQEQWNDAIIDLKIDELQKQNDEFKQRLEIMDAIQEVEDAQQRRISIYREGQGFVYEADKEALDEAQDNLEEAVNDLIINQLEATKELSNIYDSVGNQLIEVKDMLSDIDFSKYYGSVSAGVEDSTLLKDALSAVDTASIISNLANKDVSIDLSGMTLNNVNSVEELVDAIINQLPGYILQELHSKS